MKDDVKATKLEITLPFGIGKITLEPDETERIAAWELYVELSTRISSARIVQADGLIREALSSLYSILNTTPRNSKKSGAICSPRP